MAAAAARGPSVPARTPSLGRRGLSLAALGLSLAGCGKLEDLLGGGGETPADTLPAGLDLSRCRSEPGLYDVSGVYAARFETVANLSGGPLEGAQTEIVTRYAAMQLCQLGPTVEAVTVVCAMHHSPALDRSQTCAAQVPDAALLRGLPAVVSRGEVDLTSPERAFRLPWAERWGLAEAATLPVEPAGARPLTESAGVVDTDGDSLPGVTLQGDGEVPTVSWVARLTEAELTVRTGDGVVLSGSTRAATAETVLGGPASRWLRGRRRSEGQGALDLVRVDGVGGAPDLLAAGRLSCAAVVSLVGEVFNPPRRTTCD